MCDVFVALLSWMTPLTWSQHKHTPQPCQCCTTSEDCPLKTTWCSWLQTPPPSSHSSRPPHRLESKRSCVIWEASLSLVKQAGCPLCPSVLSQSCCESQLPVSLFLLCFTLCPQLKILYSWLRTLFWSPCCLHQAGSAPCFNMEQTEDSLGIKMSTPASNILYNIIFKVDAGPHFFLFSFLRYYLFECF